MKIQDILFIIIVLMLLYKHKENSFLLLGLVCLLIAIPLFYFYIFFTAERLVWYGILLILIECVYKFIILSYIKSDDKKENKDK